MLHCLRRWRSFFTSGSSALYLFLYSAFYFYTKLDITKARPALRVLYASCLMPGALAPAAAGLHLDCKVWRQAALLPCAQ